jgi:hypothetical protein
MEEVKDNSTNELIAQSIIALAPILLGAAAQGTQGGAIGGQAGLAGLKQFQSLAEREQERKTERERLARTENLQNLEQALKLSQEERAQKASARAEERQTRELALKEKELGLKEGQEKKIPRSEYTAATWARRMEQAENVFDQLEKSGFDRASLAEAAKTALPEAMKSSALKAQQQAEKNFVEAFLRPASGAAISQAEYKNAEAQFFPRQGDSPEVKEQKRANRLQVQAGLRAEAGKVLEKIPYVPVNLNLKQKQEMIPSAQAAPAMPDFNKMSLDDLKKYLGM